MILGLDARKPVFGGLQTTKASAQSDQRLRCSNFGKDNIEACYKRNFQNSEISFKKRYKTK